MGLTPGTGPQEAVDLALKLWLEVEEGKLREWEKEREKILLQVQEEKERKKRKRGEIMTPFPHRRG